MVIINAKNLQAAIARRFWTRKKLEKESGVACATLTKIFNGQPVTLKTVARLAYSLEVDPREIL